MTASGLAFEELKRIERSSERTGEEVYTGGIEVIDGLKSGLDPTAGVIRVLSDRAGKVRPVQQHGAKSLAFGVDKTKDLARPKPSRAAMPEYGGRC